MSALFQGLQYALRTLRHNPGGSLLIFSGLPPFAPAIRYS